MTAARRWRVGVVAACLAVGFAVGAVVASAAQGAPAPPRRRANSPAVVVASVPAPAPAALGSGAPVSFVDTFDRPDSPAGLGAVPGGPAWLVVAGTWGVGNQQAHLSAPGGGTGVAVVPVSGIVTAAQVRVADVVPGTGLVFAYRDPADYWLVEAEPGYGTWNIVQMAGGAARGRGNVGLAPTAGGTVASVAMSGTAVTVAIDGNTVRTLIDPSLGAGTAAGLAVSGSAATSARFEDFQLTSLGA